MQEELEHFEDVASKPIKVYSTLETAAEITVQDIEEIAPVKVSFIFSFTSL